MRNNLAKRAIMSHGKIENALSTALKHLENTLVALSNNDEKALADSLWSTSAEIEYAVFLLSLMRGDREETASWKRSASSKQTVEFEPALTSAQELLKNAEADVIATNFKKAYEETWTARNLLLRAQEMLEKKRKETKK